MALGKVARVVRADGSSSRSSPALQSAGNADARGKRKGGDSRAGPNPHFGKGFRQAGCPRPETPRIKGLLCRRSLEVERGICGPVAQQRRRAGNGVEGASGDVTEVG